MTQERETRGPCDVAIQTIIGEELDAVLRALKLDAASRTHLAGDSFWTGEIESPASARALSVVVHCQGEAGNAASSAAATKLIERFGPRMMILSGIAAGRRGKVKIGDVAVPRVILDMTQKVAEPYAVKNRPVIPRLPHAVGQLLRAFAPERRGWHDTFRELFGDPLQPPATAADEYAKHVATVPALHEVAIASDDVLLRNPKVLQDYASQIHQQTQIGEMEAAGFTAACESRYPSLPWLVVRSVSDFGDDLKNDNFHRLASIAAASYVVTFLRHGLDIRIFETSAALGGATAVRAPVPSAHGALLASSNAPMAPEHFLGRSNDLDTLAEMLGDAANSQSVGPVAITAVRGLAGVGKTAVASYFASDRAVRAGFVDGVLWGDLARAGRFMKLIKEWSHVLDDSGLSKAAHVDEAVDHLRRALKSRRILVVLDDLRTDEAVLPIRSALGTGSGLLLVTRVSGLPTALGVPAKRMHTVEPLDMDVALKLLDKLCPGIVARDESACTRLLEKIDCIPIAICVAGRLLRLEEEDGLDVPRRLRELDASLLLSERAPPDRADPETGATPTIRTLLQTSIDELEGEQRERFAMLGAFGSEISFGEEELASFWHVEDPRPTIRILRQRGLIEVVAGRYSLHSLFAALAAEMLDSGKE